jgi:hypothetical protein
MAATANENPFHRGYHALSVVNQASIIVREVSGIAER